MTLLIDVGNSSIKWAQYNSDGLLQMQQQSYPEETSSEFFIECWSDLEKPKNILVSCVAGKTVWQTLVKACEKLWGIKAEKVTSEKKGFGLVNAYEKASDLGSDRWCGMIGAHQETDTAYILIDSGSALTIDVVTESGEHLGGYILPGLDMMKKSLGLQTAQVKIKQLSDKKPLLLPATSTTGCVDAAVHLSTIKLIESVIKEQQSQRIKVTCFLTGGNADLISGLLAYKCVIMPDIVLRGLAYISENYFSNGVIEK